MKIEAKEYIINLLEDRINYIEGEVGYYQDSSAALRIKGHLDIVLEMEQNIKDYQIELQLIDYINKELENEN
jgi:hypothetical protein